MALLPRAVLFIVNSKTKKRHLLHSTETMCGISGLPYVQNKDYQYSVSHPDILRYS